MWKLKSTKKDHWEHFLFVGDDCVVGRKGSSLLISNDPSVSRKHAMLFVKHPEENLGYPSRKSSLFLRDEGSKYGTFKNNARITTEEELVDGDVIKFGQFESEFRVHYEPLIVTTSCLDNASKNKLKNSIHRLGGHVVSEWQPSCTHLVMSQVKVTIKALCCLVSLKSIVLPEYFQELEKKLKSSATVVPPSEFIPPIGESLIDKDQVSFDVDPQRKNIFKNKTFFFMDEKQFKKLHLGIIMGGGNASILSEGKGDIDLYLQENTCFIEPARSQVVKEESKKFLQEVISTLQKKSLRMIPESDIGLAVAYSSTEKFCNPSFNVGSLVLGSQKIPSQTLSEREVYVPDTQDRTESKPTSSRISSLLNCESEPKSKKQKLEAPDSLNLTSFRGDDPEEIFEIPLSAQVKQELDDIFEVTMKAVNKEVQNEETLPSTLPAEPRIEEEDYDEPDRIHMSKKKEEIIPAVVSSRKRKAEEKMSEVNGNGNELGSASASSRKMKFEENISVVNGNEFATASVSLRKPKIEENTSAVNGNGFNSAITTGDDESSLPRNLINVTFASLIIRKQPTSVNQQSSVSHMKNFKKFKKVLPKKAQVLPRIIGGHDLVPYDKDAAKFVGENWEEDAEIRNDQPVRGMFDWDTPAG